MTSPEVAAFIASLFTSDRSAAAPWRMPPQNDTLLLTGCGDLDALRQLADRAHSIAKIASDDLAPVAYTEAITFARLAASHGHYVDMVSLIFLQSQFSAWLADHGNMLDTFFEAMALLDANSLADAGHEGMADMISRAGSVLPAAVFEEAKRIRANLQQQG